MVSVAEETGLKLAFSETPKTGSLTTRPICRKGFATRLYTNLTTQLQRVARIVKKSRQRIQKALTSPRDQPVRMICVFGICMQKLFYDAEDLMVLDVYLNWFRYKPSDLVVHCRWDLPDSD